MASFPKGKQPKSRPTRTTIVRILTAVAVILVILLLLDKLAPLLPQAEKWIEAQGIWAPVFYILLVVLLTLICFPMDVLFIAAGMIFGLRWGALYLVIATMLSQAIIFLVSRHLLRAKVERWMRNKPKMQAINRAIELRGARLLFLIRMAPVPASPISYLMGVSKMRFDHFLIATLGIIPVSFASMYFGYAAIHFAQTTDHPKHHFDLQDFAIYAGLALAIAGSAYIGHTARKALQQAEAELKESKVKEGDE
ncbi:TVP38/TMEM64 family protein [Cerasicoccus maritimus]|uniref:TVP38/TMEM64 family protein n=1 Tax=Cerasicoccus maritimus TaxID=490089 RepID=UPI002852B358|nr:VTT domain-containing protein [Cerasicoccus maritimus]